MYKLQEQLGAIVQADPDVATVAMALGTGVGNSAQNSGRMFITLKPREERTPTRSRSSPGCGPSSPRSRARSSICRWRRT